MDRSGLSLTLWIEQQEESYSFLCFSLNAYSLIQEQQNSGDTNAREKCLWVTDSPRQLCVSFHSRTEPEVLLDLTSNVIGAYEIKR